MGEASFVAYKILIQGPWVSGKTTFIHTICDRQAYEDIEWPTLALSFGQIVSEDQTVILCLYGTPGVQHFHFMWEILASGCLGCIIVFDIQHPETFQEARALFEMFSVYSDSLPCVIAANFQDSPDAWDVEALRIALHISGDIPIVPCVATDRESVKGVMITLLEEVLKDALP